MVDIAASRAPELIWATAPAEGPASPGHPTPTPQPQASPPPSLSSQGTWGHWVPHTGPAGLQTLQREKASLRRTWAQEGARQRKRKADGKGKRGHTHCP